MCYVMIKEFDVDLVSGQVLYIDFQCVNMFEKIWFQVLVEFIGELYGVCLEGGMIDFINCEVEVECFLGNIFEMVIVNIEELYVGQYVEVKDFSFGDGVELIDDLECVIVLIMVVCIVEMVEEEDGEEVVEGGEVFVEVVDGGEG